MNRIIYILLLGVLLAQVSKGQDVKLMTPGELLLMIKDDDLNIEMAKWQIEYEDTVVRRPMSREDVFLIRQNDSLKLRTATINSYITKYHHMADQSLTWKHYKNAAKYYRQAYKQDTTNYHYLTLIGLSMDLDGQVEDAMKIYNQVLKLNPIDYRAYWRVGMIYYAQDNFEKAFAPIMRAHLLNRNNISIEHFLDRVLSLKKLRYKIWDFVPRSRILSYDSKNLQVATDSCWYAYAQTKAYLHHSQVKPGSQSTRMTL